MKDARFKVFDKFRAADKGFDQFITQKCAVYIWKVLVKREISSQVFLCALMSWPEVLIFLL